MHIDIDNTTLDQWYCRIGPSIVADSSARDHITSGLVSAISRTKPTHDVQVQLQQAVSDYLGRQQSFTLIKPGQSVRMEKLQLSWTTCVHVDVVADDANRVRMQTLVLHPTTDIYDLALLCKKGDALTTAYASLYNGMVASALTSSPQESGKKRRIYLVNDTPLTWYCDVQTTYVRSVNHYRIRKNLMTAISAIAPTDDADAQVAAVAADYYMNKLRYHRLVPNQAKVWVYNVGHVRECRRRQQEHPPGPRSNRLDSSREELELCARVAEPDQLCR